MSIFLLFAVILWIGVLGNILQPLHYLSLRWIRNTVNLRYFLNFTDTLYQEDQDHFVFQFWLVSIIQKTQLQSKETIKLSICTSFYFFYKHYWNTMGYLMHRLAAWIYCNDPIFFLWFFTCFEIYLVQEVLRSNSS